MAGENSRSGHNILYVMSCVKVLETLAYQLHTWAAEMKWCPGIQDTLLLSSYYIFYFQLSAPCMKCLSVYHRTVINLTAVTCEYFFDQV